MGFFRLRNKLFLVMVTLSIVPIIIVTFYSYRSYTQLVNRQTSLVASTTIGNAAERIDEVLANIDRISLTIQQQSSSATAYSTVSDELKRLSSTDDPYERFLIRSKLKLIFENILLSYDYVNGIYIFAPDGNSISYGGTSDLKYGYVPIHDDWYKKTLENRGQMVVGSPGVKPFIINAKPSISFSRALYDLNTQQFLGVFMIDCSTEIFNELKPEIIPAMTRLYLIDETNAIIYDNTEDTEGEYLPSTLASTLAQLPDSETSDFRTETMNVIDESLIVAQTLPSYNWRIVASISLSGLYDQYGISQKLIGYISLTCALIFLLLSIAFSTWITNPISRLVTIMRSSPSRLGTTGISSGRRDEIGVLYAEYDKMLKDIDLFVKERYQNRILTLDAQMKALEAQINSHFLFNTLESINSIAEIEEVESIAVMTKALGDMFRYSIRTDSERVYTREELKHVSDYMAIQQIRYGDKIGFHTEIDPEVMDMKILKLILQPLIENAIYHGLEGKKGGGSVTIRGYIDRSTHLLYFEVCDNGKGMSEARLQEIRTLLEQPPEFLGIGQRTSQSIGIKNVHSRIALYYGEAFGLTLSSMENEGTSIRLTLPIENGGNEHV
ncbi:sensor histidine kinase [Saccharibacillus kuerlensis]|uniref:Histidine kinase n=1 Tax=Saccharibacillus kuerlensis TaxID=459527 RepID=A0ABQ2L405_9BACL|nr:sensor histidine kinase [Saccharibacillus kuerlensis]GGO01749.1 histidine kinase [Saccharibacillus kuerlensis]